MQSIYTSRAIIIEDKHVCTIVEGGVHKLPGGGYKIGKDKSPLETVLREVPQEIGSKIDVEGWPITLPLFEDGRTLFLFEASIRNGEPYAREGNPIVWIPVSQLPKQLPDYLSPHLAVCRYLWEIEYKHLHRGGLE